MRLGIDDLAVVQSLYALWAQVTGAPEMLREGIVFGVYDGKQLVAIAGTHARSRRHRAGAIGGVFTHPAYRSRGLAGAATGAVAGALVANGVRDIVLNVRADNRPAIAAYRRLGFREYMGFTEGQVVRRDSVAAEGSANALRPE